MGSEGDRYVDRYDRYVDRYVEACAWDTRV